MDLTNHNKEFEDMKGAPTSKLGCGTMLTECKENHLRSVRSASRTFSPAESRWHTRNKSCLLYRDGLVDMSYQMTFIFVEICQPIITLLWLCIGQRSYLYESLSDDFYWRNMSKHVRNWISRCADCIRFRTNDQRPTQVRLYAGSCLKWLCGPISHWKGKKWILKGHSQLTWTLVSQLLKEFTSTWNQSYAPSTSRNPLQSSQCFAQFSVVYIKKLFLSVLLFTARVPKRT